MHFLLLLSTDPSFSSRRSIIIFLHSSSHSYVLGTSLSSFVRYDDVNEEDDDDDDDDNDGDDRDDDDGDDRVA